ncbi:hypothetical protein OVA24_13760 [Luteolibacter sp. SL250]|uniref:hypothetical protein n=1 Tax=Luteolibacter sp. SL250 TaxID=2995170 RepID=UPI0022703AD4|nr:hypothetical protein [Luteolibacter sp. SL250]WAC18301.1 hypothetical protein OVA24_13760 [Luteolibacter sp. SL250]
MLGWIDEACVMARNTNSNIASNPKNIYATVGNASGVFDFSLLTAMNQSNVGHANTVPNAYSTFVDGKNHVKFTFTIAEGQTFFLAVDGSSGIDNRSFLNMVQIVQVPERGVPILLCGSCLMLGFPHRR